MLDIAFRSATPEDVRGCWNASVADLSEEDDPLVRAHGKLELHTDSALRSCVVRRSAQHSSALL